MNKLLKYICPFHWFKKKKKEIVFYGNYRFIDKINPIVNASDIKRSWIKKIQLDFNKRLLEKNMNIVTSGHRCLGIKSLIKMGFVVKNEVEFAVETNGNDSEIHIHQNEEQDEDDGIHVFTKDLMGEYTRPMGANMNLIKIHTSWYLNAPKDVVFIVLPINYSDDNRFMSSTAILDPVLARQVNVILWWFVKEGYEVVKKGVPLAQLIPIQRNQVYDSWKMVDRIPDMIQDTIQLQRKIRYSTKCPYYSDYKKTSNEIYEDNL
jgi:hypothetical protein